MATDISRIYLAKLFIISTLAILISSSAHAFQPEKHLSPSQENRARNLFLQVRCPICAGQVIENSDTEIAYQLKNLIREMIVKGLDDNQIKAELIKKYGADIVTDPQINSSTLFLWFMPPILLFIGFAAIIFYFRKKQSLQN